MAEDPPFRAVVGDLDGLRSLYRQPSGVAQRKVVDHLDPAAAAFVATAPFCLLATADRRGRCDVSPRGGPPGFARVLDAHRLVIPDLSGNNLLDSLTNLVDNPNCGLLFVVPGRDETLRVEGEAWITTDDELLARWDDELRRPKAAIGVRVRAAYLHCAKSFRRGRVWDPASWAELDAAAPDGCAVLAENLGLDLDVATLRADLEEYYAKDLAGDRPPAEEPSR